MTSEHRRVESKASSNLIDNSTAAIYAVKLYNKPFWIWDIKTNGELSNRFITHPGQ